MIEITLPDGSVRTLKKALLQWMLLKILAKGLLEMLFLQISMIQLLKLLLH